MKLGQILRFNSLSCLVFLSAGLFSPAATAELFISEYVEGSSFNKAIEVYNPESETIDLSTYELQLFNNGAAGPNFTQPLSGTIGPGDVYVVANDQAAAAILSETDLTSPVTNFNGNDAVALLNGGAFIDVIGQIGFDPGTEWSSGGVGTQNETLRRKSAVCEGDADFTDPFLPDVEWDGFPQDTFDGLGAHSVTCSGGPGPGPDLVISEIMFNPASAEDNWEWVEVYNAGSETVDLAGYVLDDINSVAHPAANIAAGAIPAAGSAILFNADDLSAADFAAAWGSGINLVPVTNWETMALNNGGDTVGLWSDFASYSGDNQTQANAVVSVPYPNIDDGLGSVYLTDLGNSNSWALSNVGVVTPVGTAYQSAAAGGNSGADVGSPESSAPPVTTITLISAIQGDGAATPLNGQTVKIEAVVIGDYQGPDQLNGFFVQEEDADQDGDAATSEGIFVFAPGATEVAEGDLVTVTGTAGEFNGLTQISASASAVIVLSSGSVLPSPASVDLPVPLAVSIDAYYESSEAMRVRFVDPLYVSESFQLLRFGEVRLTEGGRVRQFTSANPPDVAGYAAHLDGLARRQIILDDDRNGSNTVPVDGGVLFHPQPSGFGVGIQGMDYFRGGDVVASMVGVLDYAFGTWRVRPTDSNPVAFAATNTRPDRPDTVGGRLKVASFNVLNYFTTIDDGTSTCGPSNIGCRGANSTAELTRQRDKIVSALAAIDADIVGLVELENNARESLQSLIDGLNAVVGTGSYSYVDTGAIGTDAIKVGFIYKPETVTPSGVTAVLDSSEFVDPNNTGTPRNRPALAQTFTENGTGAAMTVAVNHFKSKGSGCGAGDDSPEDGQGNCNGTREAAALELVNWLATDPTGSGDPDVLITGDLNAYAKEDPISAILAAGYADLINQFLGDSAYSFVFDGQIGYLDYALANGTLTPQVTGVTVWPINADEVNVFDYNDDVLDVGEGSFEEKPDGNELYEPNAFRSSDHDPVVLGLDLDVPPPQVVIDIKPGSDTNPVNLKSRGVIPVAILGSESLEVADVDASTLAFGPSGASLAHGNGPHFENVNDDGFPDLLAHFRSRESGITRGDTEACLSGQLLDGTPFEACDAIVTVPDN